MRCLFFMKAKFYFSSSSLYLFLVYVGATICVMTFHCSAFLPQPREFRLFLTFSSSNLFFRPISILSPFQFDRFMNYKNDSIISSATSSSTNPFLWVWACQLIPSARGFLIIFLRSPSAFGVQLFNRLFCLATPPSLGYFYNPYPS